MRSAIHLVFQRSRGQKRRPNKGQVETISSFGNKLASTGRISLFDDWNTQLRPLKQVSSLLGT